MTKQNIDWDQRAEYGRFGVGLLAVTAAGYFFFTLESPMEATLAMTFWLIAGELGGRTMAKWIRGLGNR